MPCSEIPENIFSECLTVTEKIGGIGKECCIDDPPKRQKQFKSDCFTFFWSIIYTKPNSLVLVVGGEF